MPTLVADSKKPTEKFEAGIPAANESRDCVVLVKVGVTDLGHLGLGIGWTLGIANWTWACLEKKCY